MKKKCSLCKEIKSLSKFPPNKYSKSGFQSACRICRRAYSKTKHAKEYEKIRRNKPKRKEYNKRHSSIFRQNNKEYLSNYNKTYHNEHKEHRRKVAKEWRKNNRGKWNATRTAYRCRKLQASPVWLSAAQKEHILWFYLYAEYMSRISGEKYSIDHIVPLKGKIVRGLHVPWNLQIIPLKLNNSKNNKFLEN